MKKVTLIFLMALVPFFVSARIHYISSVSGNDANSGLTPATAWKTLARIQTFAQSGQAAAGDTFALKCGEVFDNGNNPGAFGSMMWWGSGRTGGWVAPSGTNRNPIVFTSYSGNGLIPGVGDRPNLLFPYPTAAPGNNRFVLSFSSVKNVIIENLQFNDYRFPVNDKVGTAYTGMGILVEGSGAAQCDTITIQNCYFNNIGYGAQITANVVKVLRDTFTNMKNVGDTSGAFDIGAVPIIVSGKKFDIRYNYMKGGWAFTGCTASGQGLNGGGIEIINDFDSSFIGYNTIIDCDGVFECGNAGSGTGANSPNDDTIAYNRFINNGSMMYINATLTDAKNIRIFNNAYVENQWSRFSGPRFGTDVYNDGQSFAQFPGWPQCPLNPSTNNYAGWRPIQYPTGAYIADTVVDTRNNIFWLCTGLQMLYPTTKTNYKHRNNIYHLVGNYGQATNLGSGAALNTTSGQVEKIINTKIYIDSTSNFPQNWNYYFSDTSYALRHAVWSGVYYDYAGIQTGVPLNIGIYQDFLNNNPKKYYLSAAFGNDANNGTSPSTPWKTLKQIQYYTVGYPTRQVTFNPGDTIFFKRGEMFANGFDNYASLYWENSRPDEGYFTAPSGNQVFNQPIVLTAYGDANLNKPNLLFPYPKNYEKGNVLVINGVRSIVIDGLQFNDTRFPLANKKDPAYTRAGIILGQYSNGYRINCRTVGTQTVCDTILGSAGDTTRRKYFSRNCVVKNCYFNNLSFGIAGVAGINCLFTNNVFTNMKSAPDTIGTYDVLAGCLEGFNCFNCQVTYNYFGGAWAKSGRVSSTQGSGGVSIDMFVVKNTFIGYNTVVDGRHFWEIGNLDRYDSSAGSQYDTFAYNKIYGNSEMGYIHGAPGDPFTGNVHNIYIFNNTMVENNFSRFSGPNFGSDIYNDGQSFNQFWFFANPSLTTGYVSKTAAVTSGSNTMTIQPPFSTPPIKLNTSVYGPEGSTIYSENPAPLVSNIVGTTLTLNAQPTSTTTTSFVYYPPIADKGITWSQPPNRSSGGYNPANFWDNSNANAHFLVDYSSDNFQWGMNYDTLVYAANNILYNTTGLQMVYANRNRFKRRNNIFYLKGGYTWTTGAGTFTNLTRLGDGGATLSPGEKIITTAIFVDTLCCTSTPTNPEKWDVHVLDTSYAVSNGINVGLTKDFAGNPIVGTPTIGVYQNYTNPSGTKYYISSSSGNDLNDGKTPATAWRTLLKVQQSMGAFLPKDSILFKRGDMFSGTLDITKSGTSGSPIVFAAYGTNSINPKFIGTGGTIPSLFSINNQQYVSIVNMLIRDDGLNKTNRQLLARIQVGVLISGTSSNCLVKNVAFDRVGYGVQIDATSNTVTNCDFGNLRMIVSTPSGSDDYGAVGVVVRRSTNTITSNYFHDCYAISSDFVYDGGAIDFSANSGACDNNIFSYNTVFDCNGVARLSVVAGGTSCNTNYIFYNKLVNNGCTIRFISAVTNTALYNNVIIETDPYRVTFTGMISSSVTPNTNTILSKNNVFQLQTGIPVTTSTFGASTAMTHTNNIYKLSGGSVTNFTLTASEQSVSATTVLFTSTTGSPINWNYVPSSGSLLLGFGVNVGLTTNFAGQPVSNPPNAGIY